MPLKAGVGRRIITPPPGVELTGLGYYMKRVWRRVHDDLHATAVVVESGGRSIAVVSLDLMMIGREFTARVRKRIAGRTDVPKDAILLACTHSHNAPASQGILGGGEVDADYEEWAAGQAAEAAIAAWQERTPARLGAASGDLAGHTFNRTRQDGPVDTRLTVLRVDRRDGGALCAVVNFQAHPTVCTGLRPYDVSRDCPGEVCDRMEAALPGATALYLQGACGDVNFKPEYQNPERCGEPARLVAELALDCHARADPREGATVAHDCRIVEVPTRRWTIEEIDGDRTEALRRLETDDTSGWRETIGRVMTNRPEDMVARHGGNELAAVRAMARFNVEWTDRMLKDLHDRPESLATEVQVLRIGDLYVAANSSEMFTTLAQTLRSSGPVGELMIACYANGRIGYMPDAHDVARKTYAAYQSPKYCVQFPFTEQSGPALCAETLAVLQGVQSG